MGKVIGYNGTKAERAERWKTMRALRDSINCSRKTDPVRFRDCIKKETSWYAEELTAYARAA